MPMKSKKSLAASVLSKLAHASMTVAERKTRARNAVAIRWERYRAAKTAETLVKQGKRGALDKST